MHASADEMLRETLARAERCSQRADRAGEIAALREAVALRGDFQPVHARLGILLQESGDPAGAVSHFEAAARLRPADAGAWSNLSTALYALGRLADAERSAREALRREPSHPWAPFNLGRALAMQGRRDEARTAFEAATRASPANALAWEALGDVLLEEGRLLRAREALLRAVQSDPRRASSWSRLASSYLHMGEVRAAVDAMAKAEDAGPADAAQIGSTRLVALHYDDALDRDGIFREHERWAQRYAPRPREERFANDRAPDRRLRVGYVSPRFHSPTLSSLMEPLFMHDRAAFDVTCYSTYAAGADAAPAFRARGVEWVDASSLDDAGLAQRMREDRIDVAIDLAGHAPGNRVRAFALAPAPVTATWLDYFDTTGVPGMGYLVTDALHSPSGDGQRFSEELWRLPRLRFSYAPPAGAPELRASRFARGEAGPVFASFNRMAKISAATLHAWRLALEAVPDARLVVKNSSLGHVEERQAFSARLKEHGIDPRCVEPRGFSGHLDMLDEYNGVDVVLDTMPYNGGITTLEALWMGKPVVTIRGDTLVSRQSAAILETAGLDRWIASDAAHFAKIAASTVAERANLARIAIETREAVRTSAINDPRGLASALEGAYRSMWLRHLEANSRA